MEAASVARQQQMQQQQKAQEGVGGRGPTTASFRDVVEAFAEANGVMFLPKKGRQHEGKQIYSFGGVSIYLDQSVAFTEMPRGSGRWSPLGLEELLALTGMKAVSATAASASGSAGARQTNGSSQAFGGLD